MNEMVKVFENKEFGKVRVVTIDKEPWFVSADVCRALEIGNPRQAMTRLDDDEKNTVILNDGTPGNPEKTVVNEPGLYSLVLSSRKPSAKKFKRWVTHEVLPSIRKHGMYATKETVEAMINDPDYGIELLKTIKEERQAKEQLKVELDQSKEWYTIKRVAQFNDVSWKTFSWRKLKEASADLGYEVKKAFDANYGQGNVYHVKVWKRVYPSLEL